MLLRRIISIMENHNTANLTHANEQIQDNKLDFISQCEEKYRQQIEHVAEEIVSNNKLKVVLIAGPSSSGKTTTSNVLMKKLAEKNIHSVVISLDNFFINRADTPKLPNGNYDFESPYALDLNCLDNFIDNLLETGTALMPVYDFITGERKTKYEKIELNEHSVILIEGIHAHNPILFKSHAENMYKLYVCLNSDFVANDKIVIPAKKLRLMRRCLRDYYSRGHSISATFSMWNDVLAGEEKYIKPYKNSASCVIDSTHAYEPMLYRKYLLPLLESVEKDDRSKTLINMLLPLSELDKKYIPDESLIWEFLVNK